MARRQLHRIFPPPSSITLLLSPVPWLVSNYNKSITFPETSFLIPCYADHMTMHYKMLGMPGWALLSGHSPFCEHSFIDMYPSLGPARSRH
jgi:hypothetical protein